MTNIVIQGEELYHFGILGQKWGIRRYQNPDGSLTEAGKKHYAKTYVKLDRVLKNAPTFPGSYSDAKIKDYNGLNNLYYENTSRSDFVKRTFQGNDSYENKIIKKDEINKLIELKKRNKDAWNKEHEITRKIDKLEFDVADALDKGNQKLADKKSKELHEASETDTISIYKEINETQKQYNELQKELVDRLVGKYGSIKINSALSVNDTLKRDIDQIIDTKLSERIDNL